MTPEEMRRWVVCAALGFLNSRHEVVPSAVPVSFRAGLRQARLVPCFGAFGLEAQRAAFSQRTLLQSSLFAQHKTIKHIIHAYVEVRACTHIY